MFLKLYCFLSTFVADRKGVSALEYALMGALIAVVIVTSVKLIGTNMTNQFNNIANAIK